MANSTPNPWETLFKGNETTTSRMVVPGGWLYMIRSFTQKEHACALQFVPKPPAKTVQQSIFPGGRPRDRADKPRGSPVSTI